MWNCCPPSEPSSSVPLHFFKYVLRLPAQEMLLCLIPWVVRSSRRSTLLESPSLQVMLAGFLRARHQDNNGDWINVHLKCNLDREDYVSWRFPFLFLSWLAEVLRARRQDKDGVQINASMKCNLDREDCTSLRFPFTFPYAWISRRDSCLVGVSCHIPSFW